MARGNIAKENVRKKVKAAFGQDYISIDGSKIYVWADDGGERVQIALAMTCPKTFIETTTIKNSSTDMADEWDGPGAETPAQESSRDITPQELENVRALMERLGL